MVVALVVSGGVTHDVSTREVAEMTEVTGGFTTEMRS